MRNLEALSQFIVPLVFLAIWALTSLLNRDGQPLPKRPGVAPGPRPGFGPAAGAEQGRRDALAAARAQEAAASRAASGGRDARTVDQPIPGATRIGTARPPGRTTDADVYVIDDEMVFVDPATRRPIGSATIPPTKPGPRPAPRKPSRGRRQEPAGSRPRRGEADTPRALSDQVGLSMAQNRGEAMANLSSLASSFTSLGGKSLSSVSVAATVHSYDAPPALSAADVRQLIAEPARLREMAIIADLLQPPVSRRGRRI